MVDSGLIDAERVWGADWNCVADRDIDAWAKYPNLQGGKELDRAFAAHGVATVPVATSVITVVLIPVPVQ